MHGLLWLVKEEWLSDLPKIEHNVLDYVSFVNLKQRLMHWSLLLQDFNIQIMHRSTLGYRKYKHVYSVELFLTSIGVKQSMACSVLGFGIIHS